MPGLDRMKDADKLELCRKYFIIGCFALPFMWFINFVWFFKEAFIRPTFDEQKQLKKYLTWSLIGCIVWTAIVITWVTIFQVKRVEWGETGDRLSFIIPKGML